MHINAHIDINFHPLILNQYIPDTLRSDNPAKSYRSLHISDRWVGALNVHALFVISMLFHHTLPNCSKDLNLQTATPNSESVLTKYVQIGQSHQKYQQPLYFA